MKYIMDMVHHNPGEAPFQTAFLKPEKLRAYGFNGQVFKHLNCAALFEEYDPGLWAGREEERDFVVKLGEEITAQNREAKSQGLKVFYHTDLFVLPKALTEKHKDRLCNKETGRINLDAPDTLYVHELLLKELFTRFPEVDGLVIRVGETYLQDTPYHTGNSPICENQYSREEQADREQERYIKLISFLRREVCVRHGKELIFRTWDCFPDGFHANPDYYRAVTEAIEPHELLLFSLKHTALDFWRRVKVNECLGIGRHRQIVEVQCQREYEGKGAYPAYVMRGVIHGFSENRVKKGLADMKDNPLLAGIYTWSRGGGWYGPYIQNELWCDLNAYVIAGFAKNPDRGESEIFSEYAEQVLGMDKDSSKTFRRLCLLSEEAVLKGRYCRVYDEQYQEAFMPVCNWMRDDRLGGERQLGPIRDYLKAHNRQSEALKEKQEALELWKEMTKLAGQIRCPDKRTEEYIRVSCEYGYRLFRVVYAVWKALLVRPEKILEAVREYDEALLQYQELSGKPQCASLYKGEYLYREGEKREPGAQDMIEALRNGVDMESISRT